MFRRLILLLCGLLLFPLYAEVPQGTNLSGLNRGKPGQCYRERLFSAYMPLPDFCRKYKVSSYSSYENPTGIFYRKGERISLTLRNRPSGTIQLIIRDFREGGAHETYPLQPGRNDIVVRQDGLGYIDYRSPEGVKAPQVAISLKGGIINGVFSHHDDAATWRRLLARVPAGILDMVGERCQIVYHAEGLRQGAPDKGVEMLALYDRIVELQQKLMGWDREGIHPGNHIMCRVIWSGYMQADGHGAAFEKSTIAGISNPEGLRGSCWGVAHELGHVNQVRPGFDWVGMSEVTNNLYSQLCCLKLNPSWLRLEHEESPTADGQWMRGAVFDRYVNRGVLLRRIWQFQSSNNPRETTPPTEGGDVFVTLCPLWQLWLYCHEARGMEEFYPMIFQQVRAHDDHQATNGQLRVNFCRYASEAAQLDFSTFMLYAGMLSPVNRWVGDYGSAIMTVTKDMAAAVVKDAARFPEPDSTVIFYITANSVGIYRDRLPVEPSDDFRPAIPAGGGNIVFPADKWKNTVAFEVYEGRKPVRICLRGLGQADDASTTVICPAGATAIRAVQWDGTRYTVVEDEAAAQKADAARAAAASAKKEAGRKKKRRR